MFAKGRVRGVSCSPDVAVGGCVGGSAVSGGVGASARVARPDGGGGGGYPPGSAGSGALACLFEPSAPAGSASSAGRGSGNTGNTGRGFGGGLAGGGSGGRSRLGRVLACWALAAGLASAAVLADPLAAGVSAQSASTVLVGNTGQSGSLAQALDEDRAQAFTTGSHAGGYTLTSVEAIFPDISSLGSSTIAAGVYTDSSGSPGSSVGTLTNPSFADSSTPQQLSFTTTGIELAANTTYFVVFDLSAANAASSMRAIGHGSEDAGAAAGWSIADTHLDRTHNSEGSWSSKANALAIRLKGAEIAASCATADADGSYEVPLDWALKPASLSDGDTFRLLFVSSTLRDGLSSDIADYNSFVQTAAKAGHPAISDGCGDLFKAVASTSTVDARSNTDTESSDTAASIWWLNGNKAADNYTDFYDGTWDSYARRTEAGTTAASLTQTVLTGSNNDGTKHTTDFLGASGSRRVGSVQTNSASPLSSNSDSVSSVTRSMLGLSPLFKVEQRPTVSFLSSALSSGEQSSPALAVFLSEVNSSGADLVIPVRVKLAGTTLSASEYSLSGNDCDDAGGGSSTVTVPDGGQSDIPLIWLCGDDVDEPDETLIVELGALPDGWVAGAESEVAVTVTDDDATVVSVSASDSVLTEQAASDTASFEVSLGRRLLAGEDLHVPLEWVPNAGSIGVALPSDADPVFSVAVSGTGVAGEDLGEDEFGVRFTGHDTNTVQTATVTLTPTGNGDDDGDDESFRAEVFEAGSDWANAFTTVDGGGAPHADDNEVSFTFVDDDRVPGAGIVLDHGVLGAVAGGTVSSRVSLAVEPFGPVTVALSQSQIGAGVASVSVSSLAFDQSNWDVPQVVRVDGHAQGSSLVSYTASGGGYDGVSVDQSVIVAAVPAAPSGCWKCVWASAGNSAGQPSPSGYRVGPTPEGQAVWFTVHVDQAASVDVEARLWVVDAKGWAAFFLPGRYAARTLGVWIPAGRTSATFSVPTVDDSRHEPGGSVSARIINAQNCSASRCRPYVGYYGAGPEPSVQVADNDPAPPPRVYPHRASLSLSRSSIQEDAADPWVQVGVELSAPFTRQDAAGLSYMVCFGGDARRSRSTAQTGQGDNHTAYDYRVYRDETDSHGNTFKALKSSHCLGGTLKPGQTQGTPMHILVLDDHHEDTGERIRVTLQTGWDMDQLGYQANPSTAVLVIHNDETTTPADNDAPLDKHTPHTAPDPALIANIEALAAQTHHGTAHVNRWNRALLALGKPTTAPASQAAP